MKMTEKVDVLLATYQGEHYLQEQIQSILNQSYSDLHIWVRDDGSSDQTESILRQMVEAYPNQISLIPAIQNLGAKGNFSELMKYAKADYILFSDQDDRWLPDKVEWSLNVIKKMEKEYGHQAPLLVHTDLKVVRADMSEISDSLWRYAHLNPHSTALNRILTQNIVTGCTMMVNRSLLNLAWPIPSEAIMHDWWIALVASALGHIGCVNQPTILYRQHNANSLGAEKYSLWYFLKRKIKRSSSHYSCLYRTYEQAQVFLQQYAHLLHSHQKAILHTYASLRYLSYFERKKQMLKFRFFKNGLLHNMKAFLLD